MIKYICKVFDITRCVFKYVNPLKECLLTSSIKVNEGTFKTPIQAKIEHLNIYTDKQTQYLSFILSF